MDWMKFHELHNIAKSGKKIDRVPQPFFDLFLLLWPGDWKKQLVQMDEATAKNYAAKPKNKVCDHHIKPISESEFLIFCITILSGVIGKGGGGEYAL